MKDLNNEVRVVSKFKILIVFILMIFSSHLYPSQIAGESMQTVNLINLLTQIDYENDPEKLNAYIDKNNVIFLINKGDVVQLLATLKITKPRTFIINGTLALGDKFIGRNAFQIQNKSLVNISGSGLLIGNANFQTNDTKQIDSALIKVSNSSKLILENLTINQSVDHGIQIIESVLIANNVSIENNIGNGIQLQKNSYGELNNIVAYANKNGIIVSSSSAIITATTANNNLNHGIAVLHSENVTLSNINTHFNKGMGVTFGGSTLNENIQNKNWSISNLKTSNNDKNGLSIDPTVDSAPGQVWSQNGTLEFIETWNNKIHGIYVTHSSDINIKELMAYDNKKAGIAISNSTNTNWENIRSSYNKNGIGVYGNEQHLNKHKFINFDASRNKDSSTHLAKKNAHRKNEIFQGVIQ